MFSFHWDNLGGHFYTYLECTTYHFGGFYLKFQYFFTAQPKMPAKYVGMILYQCIFLQVELSTHESPLGMLSQAETIKKIVYVMYELD